MTIPIGTKFLTDKRAPADTGYQVKKLLSNGEYWCQNISAHHQLDPLAGTTFPNNFVESIVYEPWQPKGLGLKKSKSPSAFGIKRKSRSPSPPKSSRRRSSRRRSSRKKNN
jgi:hypothetical protein